MIKNQVAGLGILISILAIISFMTTACGSASPTPSKTWSQWDFTNAPRTIISSSIPLTTAWRFTATNSIYWTPVIEQDLVLVRSEYGLQAVDRVTGQEKWAYSLGRSSGEDFPLVTDGTFVVIAGKGHVCVLDLESGREVWQQEMTNAEIQKQMPGGIVWLASLAMDSERVYVAGAISSISQVEAYDLYTGALQWRQDKLMTKSMPEVYLFRDGLQILSAGRFILDRYTGVITKEREELAFNTRLATTMSGETIFIARRDGTLRAVDLTSLETRWSLGSTCPREGSDYQFPTIVGDTVYAGSGCSEVYAADLLTGKVLWTYRPNEKLRVASSIAVLDGIGYVIYSDGFLRAIDLDSGKEVGLLQTEPSEVPGVKFGAGITAANGYVYAYFGGRGLFAFKAAK